MTEEKIRKIEPIVSWITAMILCPLGVCLSAKSGFGVSMIEAPVYVVFLKVSEFFSWFTFGTSEYLMQAAVLILMCLIIRRFRLRYLLSFATAVLFGWILDGWNLLFSSFSTEALTSRIILAVVGGLSVAFAVAMFFRTWLPQEVWELFVKEVSQRYAWNMTKVKWIYDISSLLVGVVLMLCFFGRYRWDAIGIGTIITTFVNAPLIGAASKILDRFWNGVTVK